MNIGFIADNTKKGLLEDFCIAYRGILIGHQLFATGTSGRTIERAANLPVYKFLAGEIGGDQQMSLFIEQSQLDMLIVFKESTVTPRDNRDVYALFKQCDLYNIPLATNLATAEMLIKSLERGDLDWREIYRDNT